MLAALRAAFTGRRPPAAATPQIIDLEPEPDAPTPDRLLAPGDSPAGSRPPGAAAASQKPRSRHPDPVHMPLAAHVAALRTWAADVARLADGAVLAAELTAAYREMCGEHNWHALHWDMVAAALRAETGLVKRYAWVGTELGSQRLCVYDLPPAAGAATATPRPNFKAAKAAAQTRGPKGRFTKTSKSPKRRAA